MFASIRAPSEDDWSIAGPALGAPRAILQKGAVVRRASNEPAFDPTGREGRDITDAETVAAIAEPLGIDRDALLAAVQDPAIKQRLKDETGLAIEAGVFGSPFFIIDGEPFWGSDRLWMIRRWMKTGGW